MGHRHKTDTHNHSNISLFQIITSIDVSLPVSVSGVRICVNASLVKTQLKKSLFYVCELKYEHASNDGINDKTVIQNPAFESYLCMSTEKSKSIMQVKAEVSPCRVLL